MEIEPQKKNDSDSEEDLYQPKFGVPKAGTETTDEMPTQQGNIAKNKEFAIDKMEEEDDDEMELLARMMEERKSITPAKTVELKSQQP